jgi:hypothetical protein
MERGCTTEMCAMDMSWGSTMRTSPRGSARITEPSGAVPELAERPGRRRRGGSRAQAMSALCMARHKIVFRMLWRNVTCAARAGHRMPWSASERRRAAQQPHSRVGAFRSSAEWSSRWQRPVWTSLLLNSSKCESESVSS